MSKLTQSVIFRQSERLYDGYLQKLDQLNLRLQQKMTDYQYASERQLQEATHRLQAQSPQALVQGYQGQVQQLERLLRSNMAVIYDNKVAEVKRLSDALLMLDTSRIVARGYAMVERDEQVLESVAEIKEKDQLTLVMKDGQVEVEVKNVKREKI